ncbi:MAG: hypothetical protein JW967_11680 [Dehalococcoidales bacterium]|nr:hypothetical protein [Dehalococcoidales bacterium]
MRNTGLCVDIKSLLKNRTIIVIIGLFSVLELVDAFLTNWAINRGLVWEGNPLISGIAGNVDFLILKGAGAILSGLIVLVLFKHFPKLSLATGVSIALFYMVILTWNTGLLLNVIA